MAPIAPTLIQRSQHRTQEPSFQQLLRGYCEHISGKESIAPLHAEIHPNDQMLLHSLAHHQNADIALSQYFGISLQQYFAAQQIFSACFDPDDSTVTILDFACGYGRLLRLLTTQIPSSRIWASDIQTEATDFATAQFGVHGIASNVDPAQFNPERTFDFIWVASLFSHLPEGLFHAWMDKLQSLLSPRGILCFSTRDEALLPAGQVLAESGIRYFGVSETTPLSEEVYGTTYVNQAFVERAIRGESKAARPIVAHRLAKALAHEQDLYVVGRDPRINLAALANFRRGAWGWVDVARINDGVLRLEGWAASLDDGALEKVWVVIDDARYSCATGIERADVAAAFNNQAIRYSGWSFEQRLAPGVAEVSLRVEAQSVRNERALLFSGVVL